MQNIYNKYRVTQCSPLTWEKFHQILLFCFFSPSMYLNCIDVSSYKYRIRSAKRYHAFPLIVDGLHQCFLFLLFIFVRVKPLHYISWLIGHEGTGSILSVLRKKWVLLLLSVCFSDLRALQNPIKSSSICWAYMSFFSRSAPALSVWAQSSYYTLCHPTWQCDSYVLVSGYGCTSAFQPLVAKWWSDLPNLVSSHVTKSPSNAPFTISTTWIV